MKIGNKETLEFNFMFHGNLNPTAHQMAWGFGSLHITNKKIWLPNGEMFYWSWIDLLDYLGCNWTYLCYEDCYPIPNRLKMDPPMKFNRPWDLGKIILETRANSGLSESELDKEERDVVIFEERHDLSSGMVGIQLPSVYFIREGSDFGIYWGDNSDEMCHLPARDVVETLTSVGDFISNRASKFSENNEYAKIRIDQWSKAKRINVSLSKI